MEKLYGELLILLIKLTPDICEKTDIVLNC